MKKTGVFLFALCLSGYLRAQDDELSDSTLDEINDKWYASPWVWVAGAAFVIILLVVLSQSKNNKA